MIEIFQEYGEVRSYGANTYKGADEKRDGGGGAKEELAVGAMLNSC
ncbi:342_t:CDS:2 [Paraglomus occultum]|uniref:342_t:CDS:1 n=1 Tax=Paraglomus occultum TaxID=144539 RepID=A0A9N8ZRI9_9GLOM|nr:342_t:CDS:2 [Paraglomus occultum]